MTGAASHEPPPNWTFETLCIYLERIIDLNDKRYEERDATREASLGTAMTAAEKAVNAALAAAEKAVTKAETSAEKRFDSQNEFREQLKDQATTFMPRSEAQLQLDALNEKMLNFTRDEAQSGGRSLGRSDIFGWIVAGITLLVILTTLVIYASRRPVTSQPTPITTQHTSFVRPLTTPLPVLRSTA